MCERVDVLVLWIATKQPYSPLPPSPSPLLSLSPSPSLSPWRVYTHCQYQERESDVVTGSTQIRVDISYSADHAQTEGHKWHIHMNPSIDGQVCAGTIGGHYNPFSVSLGESSTSVHKLVFTAS